ncbi:MAG TPA: radical SAM protein, partial [Bryobacteraceae bacterium]|nr:radical SAM protein [Bryobacteraceae bacterium]
MREILRGLAQAAGTLATRRIRFELDLVPLRFERLPIRKTLNWLRTESSAVFRPARAWGLPTILQVEPTSRCNLKCRICPVARGMERASGDMDPALFKRIVEEIGDCLLVIMFWDWGEPFLHPSAYEMIRYARQAGIKVVASTNGHVLADGGHARQVVESGLDVLVISVDGADQATYQHFREKGRLDTVLEGVRRLVSEKRRLGSRTPVVNLRSIVMKHSEHQVADVHRLAEQLGVDILTLRKFHFVPGTGGDCDPAEAGGDALVPSEIRYQLPALLESGREPVRVSKNPCRNLWNCPTVHWDGTVCSCFMDYNERRPLGSLRER